MAFSNKSIINHKSVSASRLFLVSVKWVWTESMRGTRGRRGNGQKKQLNVTYLSIKLLAPVRLAVAPHYHHQSEYINKFSRQIFTWMYCIEREGARANGNTNISVSPKIQVWLKLVFSTNVTILAFRHFRKISFNIFLWIIGLLNLGYLSNFKRNNNIMCKQIAMRGLFCNKVNTVL